MSETFFGYESLPSCGLSFCLSVMRVPYISNHPFRSLCGVVILRCSRVYPPYVPPPYSFWTRLPIYSLIGLLPFSFLRCPSHCRTRLLVITTSSLTPSFPTFGSGLSPSPQINTTGDTQKTSSHLK